MRRRTLESKKLVDKEIRFTSSTSWTIPAGCKSIDIFLVGGGGGGSGDAGGSGYTKVYKSDNTGWKDGNSIKVSSGQRIQIIVGKGGQGVTSGSAYSGGYSQFMNSSYRSNGGVGGTQSSGGNGGSGGGPGNGGSDGSNGDVGHWTGDTPGKGQGHTTRDFGESNGKRNAGGGGGQMGSPPYTPGQSDYTEGSGENGQGSLSGKGGGGYGGGGGSYYGTTTRGGSGGDGTVLIRYYAYKE